MYSGTGKSQPSGPPFSGKLGNALFHTGTVDPRVGISLSPLNTNDGFSLQFMIMNADTATDGLVNLVRKSDSERRSL